MVALWQMTNLTEISCTKKTDYCQYQLIWDTLEKKYKNVCRPMNVSLGLLLNDLMQQIT